MPATHTLSVALGERSYPIVIGDGLLGGGLDLSPYLQGSACLIVTNETIAPLYVEPLTRCLPGREPQSLSLPDGEAFKTLAAAESVIDALVRLRAGRDATVIALGGGVVGDIAGFAAACYMRGVAFLQVPTSLLAQVDSSVGGKTGVNHPGGKNLIGAFHQPKIVVIDVDTLGTLPDRELRAGLAEVIKHAAIADEGFFGWLEDNIGSLLQRNSRGLQHAIRRSCEIKAAVVQEDERERGKRALLNFGHTFAHAIENTLGYGEWLHGEAVAAGMVMATHLSDVASEERDRLERLLAAAGLPVAPPAACRNRLADAMQLDKKAQGGHLRFVLLRRIGEAYVTGDYVKARLEGVLAAHE